MTHLIINVPGDHSCCIHTIIGIFCLAATTPRFGAFSEHDPDSLYKGLQRYYKEHDPGFDADEDMQAIVAQMRKDAEITRTLLKTDAYQRLGFNLLRAHLSSDRRRNMEASIIAAPHPDLENQPLPPMFEQHANSILRNKRFGVTPWCTATDNTAFINSLQYDIGLTDIERRHGRERTDSIERQLLRYVEAKNDPTSDCQKIQENQARGVHWGIQMNDPALFGFQAHTTPHVDTSPPNSTDIVIRDPKGANQERLVMALDQLSQLVSHMRDHYEEVKENGASLTSVWDKLNIDTGWKNHINNAGQALNNAVKDAEATLQTTDTISSTDIQYLFDLTDIIEDALKEIHSTCDQLHYESLVDLDTLREQYGPILTMLKKLIYLCEKHIFQQKNRWQDLNIPARVSKLDCFFKPQPDKAAAPLLAY